MPATTYRIKVSRGESQFEFEGDKKFVLEMLQKYGEEPAIHARTSEVEQSSAKSRPKVTAPTTGTKKMSVGEFVRQLGVKKHTDKVLAFGYFLEKHAGATSFTPSDINACYYEAKLDSSNTSQMIVYNIRRGFMMVAKSKDAKRGKKSYTLTHSGESHVEKGFSKAAK